MRWVVLVGDEEEKGCATTGEWKNAEVEEGEGGQLTIGKWMRNWHAPSPSLRRCIDGECSMSPQGPVDLPCLPKHKH